LHSADKKLAFNEKFQSKRQSAKPSCENHLPLKVSANNTSGHFANSGKDKDPLQYEANCNYTINLKSLKFLINKIEAYCLARIR
jgi:hypothetical protein